MATHVKRMTQDRARAAIAALLQLPHTLSKLKAGQIFHGEKASDAGAPGSAIRLAYAAMIALDQSTDDLPEVILAANAVKALYNLHIASVISATTGQGAHLSVDAANPITSPDATDQGTANTLLNEIKTDYNIHRASAVFHYTADATNTISAADATNLATSQTLADELLLDIAAHVIAGFNFSVPLEVAP